jgi:hypothetical protein
MRGKKERKDCDNFVAAETPEASYRGGLSPPFSC